MSKYVISFKNNFYRLCTRDFFIIVLFFGMQFDDMEKERSLFVSAFTHLSCFRHQPSHFYIVHQICYQVLIVCPVLSMVPNLWL